MKNLLVAKATIVALALLLLGHTAWAQTTDIPRMISYQGIVTQNGTAVTGEYPVTVKLYADPDGKETVWQGTYTTHLENGMFNLMLGSGENPLPANDKLDKPLWVGVTMDGSLEMKPYTQLSASPYAFNIPDKSITKEKMGTDYISSVEVNGEKVTRKGSILKLTDGAGVSLMFDRTTNSLSINSKDSPGGGQTAQALGDKVLLGGQPFNATNEGDEWIGSDNTGSKFQVWFKTKGTTVMRYLPPSGTGTIPNIIGGYENGSSGNDIRGGDAEGSVIAGGGATTDPNVIGGNPSGGNSNDANFSFIGSGLGNVIALRAVQSVVVGGKHNFISSKGGFVGGGYDNGILSYGDGTGSEYNAIVGGRKNRTGDTYLGDSCIFVGGGDSNYAREEFSVIGGGHNNVSESGKSVIGGGENNRIVHEDSLWASYSVIGGGLNDTINSQNGFIGGGRDNSIGKNMTHATNHSSDFGVIAGGDSNEIFLQADHGTIGGGQSNKIDTGGHHSFIGGGLFNIIRSTFDVIGGGDSNLIDVGLFPSRYNFIGGGLHNVSEMGCDYNVIGGGRRNENGGAISVIGGGDSNRVHDECLWDVIGGGHRNYIGDQNHTPLGPAKNFSVIGGGDTNTVTTPWSTIAGGRLNLIQDNGVTGAGHFATIPGGNSLIAQSYAQTVMGSCNRAAGKGNIATFLTSSRKDEPLVIVGNGADPGHRSNAFEVSNDGHSVVYDLNGSGGATTPIPPNPRPAIVGATYNDNIIYAWADVSFLPPVTMQVNADFGVVSVTRVVAGQYLVTLNTVDPVTFQPVKLSAASIVPSLVYDSVCVPCSYITTTRLNTTNNTFVIEIWHDVSEECVLEDHSFMFILTGRP
jgi:hypothetical protein